MGSFVGVDVIIVGRVVGDDETDGAIVGDNDASVG